MPLFKLGNISFRFHKRRLPFNLLSLLDRSLRSVAIEIIGGYQHHVSPRKGYSCTHRVVYGGDSCSEYVKRILADKSLFEATLLSRQRFRECNSAYTFSKNQVVKHGSSAIVSAGPDDGIIQLFIGLIILIFGLIFRFFGICCNKK